MIEGEFSVDAGLKLASKTWPVEQGATRKGVVLFLHDLAEYTGVYDEFFADFAKSGFEVVSYDQRGSGLSIKDGRYAGITNEHFVFDDLNRIIVELFSQLSESGDKPYDGKFYLMGHGMGASIVLNYGVKGTYRERVDGYIAGGTWVALGNDVFSAWTLKVQLPLLSKVKPKSQFTRKLRWDKLTNDEEIANKLRNDVKIRHTFSAGQIDGCLDRASRLTNSVFVSKFIGRPVLLLHGSDDVIFPLSGAQQFFNLLQVEDKKMLVLKNFLHQPYNQIKEEREEYRTDIIDWLNEKSSGKSEYAEFSPKEPVTEESAKDVSESSAAPVAVVDQNPEETATPTATEEETTKDSAAVEDQTEPVKEETAQEEVATEEPIKDEPVQEEAATEEPTNENPATEELAKQEEGATEEPVAEEPTKDVVVGEEPVTEEPIEEETTTEEPIPEELSKEEVISEEPTEKLAEEPAKEEAVVEEPIEEPTEEPVTVDTKDDAATEQTKEEAATESIKEESTESAEQAGESKIDSEPTTESTTEAAALPESDKQESTEAADETETGSATETTPEPENTGSTPAPKPNTNTAKKNNKKKNNKKKGGKKK